MSWTRIILNKDQIKAGEIKKLQHKFREIFHELGMPNEMALFTGKPQDNGDLPFYLTPACSKPAENLIANYSGISSEKPKKGAIGTVLVIGFNKAWDLLLE